MTAANGWDYSVDVLVVGSGNGALTSALCCYEMGAKDVLVIEKADKYGGTSAVSGGGVWIPNNRYAKAAGANDSYEDAKQYLKNTIPAGDVPEEMIDTYLQNAPKMVDFMHERTQMRYVTLAHYPDYYTDVAGGKPGHRSMEPEPVDSALLKGEYDNLTLSHHMMRLFGVIHFTQVEAQMLTARTPGWFGTTFKMILSWMLDVPWMLKSRVARRLCTGSAGIARLRLSMMDRDMPLWLNSAMKELITDDSGKVIGAVVDKHGTTVRVQARKAVILGSGGFEHNQELREKYLPKPTNKEWSAGVRTNTGDGLIEGLKLNAATRLMDGAWWCTTIVTPDEPAPRLSIMEKSLPGSCMVNLQGKRIANESQNYMAYQKKLFEVHDEQTNSCAPMYHIFDARFRRSYIAGPLMTKDTKPDWSIPKKWYEQKFVGKANTIRELALQIGIDPENLAQTVANMNGYAKTGKDTEFQRGDVEYDRYYGDATVTPNPCLAAIDEAPFYAMKVEAGDFGTQGGLVTNPDGSVINEQGDVIAGLYAVGNCSAAILPTYPGPGSTLGPAMTMGYQAAKHITGYQD
ncbi:FAD-binding protein [Oceanicoccus sp. KOV_DT_Chl]|uniref:FAD-binding protein n=1 Tax=Oceanicoccus sp. KOV_DT_Chl TaxID=1904639 RepID=UPI000C7C8112|nr:FAD-binding protein [Oceanicoccus sp. KOV_DT_Chl]